MAAAYPAIAGRHCLGEPAGTLVMDPFPDLEPLKPNLLPDENRLGGFQ